jgi:predicted DNA-binding transcriptional regulator AlpA
MPGKVSPKTRADKSGPLTRTYNIHQVVELTQLHRETIGDLVRRKVFPAPLPFTRGRGKKPLWLRDHVDQFLKEQARQAQGGGDAA